MKRIYRLLFALHVFVGIGAIGGGVATFINSENPLGMSAKYLKNSPFHNYLIPGIILFTIIGLGNIISALMFRWNLKFQGYASSVFSWALVIWIVVQCIMLEAVAFPHVLFFCIGLVQAALSMTILFEKRQFPANIILNIYKQTRKAL